MGCTKKTVEEKYYTIPLHIYTSPDKPISSFLWDEISFGSVVRTKYSNSDRHKIFLNNDLEIEVQKICPVLVENQWYTRRWNYLIGVKSTPKGTYQAFYLLWTNRSSLMNTLKTYGVGKEKGMIEYYKNVPWEIGEFTDSLQTNLDDKQMKKFFPAFQGYYSRVQPDSIVIYSDSSLFSPFIHDSPKFY